MTKHSKSHPDQANLFGANHPASRRTLPGLAPRRKLGSPGPDELEQEGRDAALEKLATVRSGLVEIARPIAIQLAKQRSRITSVEVFSAMRAQGYDDALDSVDPRWMGAVFNEDIWTRQGFEATGSHKRPVAVWRLSDPRNIPPSPRELVYRGVFAARGNGATIEELALLTNMSTGQVRSIIKDLLTLDKIMVSSMRRRNRSRRKTNIYVTPNYHPEIV